MRRAPKQPATPKRRPNWWELANSSFGLFLLSGVLLGGAGTLYSGYQERLKDHHARMAATGPLTIEIQKRARQLEVIAARLRTEKASATPPSVESVKRDCQEIDDVLNGRGVYHPSSKDFEQRDLSGLLQNEDVLFGDYLRTVEWDTHGGATTLNAMSYVELYVNDIQMPDMIDNTGQWTHRGAISATSFAGVIEAEVTYLVEYAEARDFQYERCANLAPGHWWTDEQSEYQSCIHSALIQRLGEAIAGKAFEPPPPGQLGVHG
ncbi:hypothetical protein ACO2Q3_13725 [Caulobacter sp. KR2-114]|uniref:hypothetical protein n=1 Tax=Caulobacter sp. KR2-114 TaxID=3400912 RepID=UPI003BFF6CB0